MYFSEEFGRAFWVDDNNDLKSCPLKLNNQPDLDYVDYVSEWTDWEGVDYNLLFNIYKTELIYKRNRADNVSYNNANQKEKMNTYDEDLYKEIVKDSKFSYGKFNQHNYPIHLQVLPLHLQLSVLILLMQVYQIRDKKDRLEFSQIILPPHLS